MSKTVSPARPKSPAVTRAKPLRLSKGNALWEKAKRLIPTGCQTFSKTPNQFVDGVAPKMLVRGQGSHVWDPDGNEYIDCTLGLGPAVLGHANTEVNKAAFEASKQFSVPPLAHPLESQLAMRINALIPCAEMVRFGKNGSDATAGAVRLARAYTDREIIATCGYHGWQDWYIGATSRRIGVPKAIQELTIPFRYNDLASLKSLFHKHPNKIAAVIMEPVGFEPPKNRFLEDVRSLCDAHGALLIFDEIITGFRIDVRGAQHYFGVTPDLAAFGKALANGYPLSVLCGKRKVMELLDRAFFSFTFGGELPPIAAALKTLEILQKDRVTDHIASLGRRFRETFNQFLNDLGIPYARCEGLDFWPHYVFEPIGSNTAAQLLTLFQQEMVRNHVLLRSAAPFFSAAHSKRDLDDILQAVKKALSVVGTAVKENTVDHWLDGPVIAPVIREESKGEVS